jgi:hypothetical protein
MVWMPRTDPRTQRRTIFLLASLMAAVAVFMHSAPAGAATFDVYLEDFTDNPETEDIAYIRMYVTLAEPGIELDACTIGGAAAGWWAGTPMCFMDGPAVILEAYDHYGGNSLLDGRLFTITSNKPAVGIDRIYFWNEGAVGPTYPNLYPDPVRLVDFNAQSATFSAGPTPNQTTAWGRVKSLYR